MQSKTLEQIDDTTLSVYAVWEPILKTDDERSSRKATILFPDERVSNYWVDTRSVGELFQPSIDLKTEPAWDVYLVYAPGVTWDDAGPPRPNYFMHQLSGRLPAENRLDATELAKQIRTHLDEETR